MRTPSRFMPKINPTPTSPGLWMLLIIFLSVGGYFLYLHPVGILSFFAVVIVIGTILSWRTKAHLRNLAAHRSGESICTFAREADCRIHDPWVVRAVYEEVQDYLSSDIPSFPLRWNDTFEQDLVIDIEDLADDICVRVAERTGRDYSDIAQNPFRNFETVGDLVRFFCAQPLVQGVALTRMGLSKV